ncbi:ubiquitin-activating E1 FCCH domain-containing protein [Roseomonas mucosa]|nr:ubiquitin-activating E1 FCCH domain-containing protein [Roseomonas mucosa]
MQKKFRDSFNGTEINPARWEVAASGGGITHSVADGAVTISTGTTLDDELTLTSRTTFTIPLRIMVALNMSQRIAGQSVWLELVSIDPTTAQPDGRSAAAWRLDGASPTLANYEVGSEGAPRLVTASASTIPTTAPAGWSVLEIEPTNDESYFHGRLLDNTAARSNSYVRHQQIPEPNALYRFRIRVRNRQFINGISAVANNGSGLVRITRAAHGFATNDLVTVADVSGVPGANGTFTVTVIDANSFDLVGSTFSGAYLNTGWASVSRNLAPASNTDVKIQFVSIADYAELTTEITAGRGQSVAGQGLGVNVVGGLTVSSTVAPTLNTVGGQARNTSGAVPVMVATGYSANPTAVTTARGVDLLATLIGALVTKPYAIPEADWQYAGAAGGILNTTDVVLRAAAAAGIRNYVTSIDMRNAHATVATEVVIKDGATVIWRQLLPAAMPAPVEITFPTPLRGTAATAMNVACLTTGAQVYVNAQGFAAP